MSIMKKNVLFLLAYFVVVAGYLWFDPIVSEDVSDVAGLLIPLIGFIGMIWANAQSFPSLRHWAARLAARGAVVAASGTLLVLATYVYSWHVRPAFGLQCRPNTVANQASQSIGAGAPQTER